MSAQLSDETISKLFAYRLGFDYSNKWISVDNQVKQVYENKGEFGLPIYDKFMGCSYGFTPEVYIIDFSLNIPKVDTNQKPYSVSIDIKNDCWFKKIISNGQQVELDQFNKRSYEIRFGFLPDCQSNPELCEIIDENSILKKANLKFEEKDWMTTLRLKDSRFYWELQPNKSFEFESCKISKILYDATTGEIANIYCTSVDEFIINDCEVVKELKQVKRNDGTKGKTAFYYYKIKIESEGENNMELIGFKLSSFLFSFKGDESKKLIQNREYLFEVTAAFNAPKFCISNTEYLELVRTWSDYDNVVNQEISTEIIFKKDRTIFIIEPKLLPLVEKK